MWDPGGRITPNEQLRTSPSHHSRRPCSRSLTPLRAFLHLHPCPSLLSFPDLAHPSTLLPHLPYHQHCLHRFCRILTLSALITFNRLFLSFLTCSATPFACILSSVDPIRVAVRPHVIHLSTPVLPRSTSCPPLPRPLPRRSYALYSKPGLPETFATSLPSSRAAYRPPPTRNIHPRHLSRSQRVE